LFLLFGVFIVLFGILLNSGCLCSVRQNHRDKERT
jgi:hypothetical protein